MIPSDEIPPHETKMIINTVLNETGCGERTAAGYKCDCFTLNPIKNEIDEFEGWTIDTFEPAIYNDDKKFDDNERYGNVDHILNQFPTDQKITEIKCLTINSVTMMNNDVKALLKERYDNNISASYLNSIQESLRYWMIKKYLGAKGITEWEMQNDVEKKKMWLAFENNCFSKKSTIAEYENIGDEYKEALSHLAFKTNVVHNCVNLDELNVNKVVSLVSKSKEISTKEVLDEQDYEYMPALNIRERLDNVLRCIEKKNIRELSTEKTITKSSKYCNIKKRGLCSGRCYCCI